MMREMAREVGTTHAMSRTGRPIFEHARSGHDKIRLYISVAPLPAYAFGQCLSARRWNGRSTSLS